MQAAKLEKRVEVTPSKFVESVFQIPGREGLERFSIADCRYLYQIYDTIASRVLLLCGRQVHKSTSLGNIMLVNLILRPFFQAIYVAPRQNQAQTFSRDRIKQPIAYSDILKQFQSNWGANDNTYYKEFASGSNLRIASAYLNADSIRGKMADMLAVDELQDMLLDLLPVIEETLFTSKHKVMRYAGTPLTHTNTIAQVWTKSSTQNEWAIPCDACGSKKAGYRFWNIPDEHNIGEKGLSCAKCGELINPDHKDAQWVSRNPKPKVPIPFEGYRIPQMITPMVVWADMLDKRARYPRHRFVNEVLARPYDIGTKPITTAELQAVCSPTVSMYNKDIPFNPAWLDTYSVHNPTFGGIDWGTAENSYTVMSVATYINGKFTYVYFKRFTGREAEPRRRMSGVKNLIRRFNLDVVGCDYGGGFEQNDELQREFGANRIVKYQYADVNDFIRWENKLGRFLMQRSELMSMLFSAIKHNEVNFPRWDEFQEPFGDDILAITSEWHETRRVLMYNRELNATDDSFHSALYCLVGSMVKWPRPDLLHGSVEFAQNQQRVPS